MRFLVSPFHCFEDITCSRRWLYYNSSIRNPIPRHSLCSDRSQTLKNAIIRNNCYVAIQADDRCTLQWESSQSTYFYERLHDKPRTSIKISTQCIQRGCPVNFACFLLFFFCSDFYLNLIGVTHIDKK